MPLDATCERKAGLSGPNDVSSPQLICDGPIPRTPAVTMSTGLTTEASNIIVFRVLSLGRLSHSSYHLCSLCYSFSDKTSLLALSSTRAPFTNSRSQLDGNRQKSQRLCKHNPPCNTPRTSSSFQRTPSSKLIFGLLDGVLDPKEDSRLPLVELGDLVVLE